MGFMGILPGSAQSLISRNMQYHRPFSLHLGGAMLLHLINAGVALITKLIGSANTFVPLRIAGISFGAVGVGPWEHVRRLTPGHVHRRPIAGDLMLSAQLARTVSCLLQQYTVQSYVVLYLSYLPIFEVKI